MIDAVLSYHLNPLTCGVAKFNHRLARELGVPCAPYTSRRYQHPLVSIKPSEMPFPADRHWSAYYDLLLHDRTLDARSVAMLGASRVLYADELGCPATIDGNPTRGAYQVLAFGMAHKLALPHFARLKVFLDVHHPDYTVALSTAVHEGSPWDEALTASTAAMRAIFGDKLRVLGYLGDDALAKELQDCDAVAVFFEPAFRANNTSAWAAVDAGKELFTNTDGDSPPLTAAPSWAQLVETLRAGVPA